MDPLDQLETVNTEQVQSDEQIEVDVQPTPAERHCEDTDLLLSSAYSIKQEPSEVPPPTLTFKTENVTGESCSDYNIKTEPVDYGFGQVTSVKSEEIKQEPMMQFSDDTDDIEIIGFNLTAHDNSDICDEVVNVVRCTECFQSFTSMAALNIHLELHRREKFCPHKWLTEDKYDRIVGSKFPEINIERVSLENHGYIFPKTESKQKMAGPYESKTAPVEKMTTLQALDSLFGSNKNSTSQPQSTTKQKSSKLVKDKTVKKRQKPSADGGVITKSEEVSSSTSLPSTFTCQVCCKVNFGSLEAMRKHLAYHPHSQCVDKVNICYICDEKFDKRDHQFKVHVDRHMIEMVNSAKNQCLGCQAFFKSKPLLIAHVQKIHQKERVYPCTFCGKRYDTKDQLTRHLVIIHNKAVQ